MAVGRDGIVIGRIDVKVGHLAQLGGGHVVRVQNAKPGPVITLVNVSPANVEVVIDGGGRGRVGSDHGWSGKVGDIPDEGASLVMKIHLVQFIIEEKVGLILR